MSRSRRTALLPAALVFAALAACGPSSAPGPPPNILLITLDTTRRDHLSLHGYERPTSPFLEQMAAGAARFDLAYAPTATTGPTHASLFTSLYPPTHGVVKNGLVLADHHRTLAEILAERGYVTAAVVSSYALASRFGYDQGFAYYDDSFPPAGSSIQTSLWEGHRIEGGFDRRADATTRRAVEWLRSRPEPGRPFFLFVHYFDAHSPYEPPERLAERFAAPTTDRLARIVADYDAEIAFVDEELQRLVGALADLALEESTLVVLTADHGEGLMQHGHLEHGLHIYEEAVRVPLVFGWPGRIPAGRIVEGPVELLDVAPTILDLIGIDAGLASEAPRTLAPALLDGRSLAADRPVFLFRRHYAEGFDAAPAGARGSKYGVRRGRWKYIEGPAEGTRELYDLAADPGETRNLIGREPGHAARLAELVAAWRSATEADGTVIEIPPEVRERLEALGYVE